MGERGGAKQRRPRYGEVGRTSVRPGLSQKRAGHDPPLPVGDEFHPVP